MKTVYQFLFIVLLQIASLSSYSQDVILSSQYDVYQFNETTINGDLIINDNPAVSDAIIDLSPLDILTSVTGDVIIEDNPQLEYLGGFNNLGSVDGDFIIQDNFSLLAMDIVSVSDIGGDLIILNNTALQNVNNFGSLLTIGGTLEIKDQPNIQEVNFSNLVSIGDGLFFTSVSWEGVIFQSLTSIGGELSFLFNYPSVLFGDIFFDALQTVGGNITFNSNQGINNLDGFNSLTSASSVFILYNSSLTEIGGFNQLSEVIIMSIEGNDVLSSITGFGSLETVFVNFALNENAGHRRSQWILSIRNSKRELLY